MDAVADDGLWNLYWRGSSAMRERIEAELDPDQDNAGSLLNSPLIQKRCALG